MRVRRFAIGAAGTDPRADAPGSPAARRSGFTLIELLVSMAIILILAGMTLAALNIGANADRIPGGSRQTQSMILGARDRAIYAGEPRGVRLIKDPNLVDAAGNSIAASSFVFIGAPQSYGENRGTVTVRLADHDNNTATPDVWMVVEDSPRFSSWSRMVQRKLLASGARITFGDELRWYTIGTPVQTWMNNDPPTTYWAPLTRGYAGQPPGQSTYGGLTYRVTMAPSVLPGEEPRTLPRSVVIDLKSLYNWNRLPSGWLAGVTDPVGDGSVGLSARDNDVVVFSDNLDIVFNERGTIHGPMASMGVMPLLVVDAVDMQTGFRVRHGNAGTFTVNDDNGDGTKDVATGDQPDERESPESIVAVYTNSGTVTVAPVDDTDQAGGMQDGVRDDPWYLAETGGEG